MNELSLIRKDLIKSLSLGLLLFGLMVLMYYFKLDSFPKIINLIRR